MKPPANEYLAFVNLGAIPLWIQPNLWEEHVPIRYRGLQFIVLYMFSTAAALILIFILPMLIFRSLTDYPYLVAGLAVMGGIGGLFIGLAEWWDFTKRLRQLNAIANENQ